MKLSGYIFRSLTYYWRTNLPIIAGVAAAVAVLAGALLVGQSVRDSLRNLLFERIGSTEYVVTADHFFGEALAVSIGSTGQSCPIVYLKGTVTHEQSRIRAHAVNVYGVDERFWQFQGLTDEKFENGRAAIVGAALARHLNAQLGDGLLLRVESQQDIPREWIYGRRDNVGRTIRLDCSAVLPPNKLGDFSLRPTQGNVYAIFVPLARLQRDLGQPSRANTILLSHRPAGEGIRSVLDSLKKSGSLEDWGLKTRAIPSGNAFSLESSRILLDDSVARIALQTAAALDMEVSPVYTYLANSIRAGNKEIPYSAVTAADIGSGALTSIHALQVPSLKSVQQNPNESIWLTDWAARDLGISPGETVEMDYYFWQPFGELTTKLARFRFEGIVPISGDVDNSLAPEIPGITEANSISGWDPPFPLDLSRIRREDEEYWNQYRATPKAFLTLARGQQLWETRFGKLTALRMAPSRRADFDSSRQDFTKALLEKLDPLQAGFSVNAVKEQGLAASRGSTDFGEYFVYFSSFLIVAAILLAALFFRLMMEHRVREIGILRAAGLPSGLMRRIFLMEAVILSLAGSILGLLASIGYGWFMVFGLRTWWVGAVGTQRLSFHISWTDLATGVAAGIGFSMILVVWTLRGLDRSTPRQLLTGVLESVALKARRIRVFQIASVLALIAAGALLLGSFLGNVSQLEGFFGSGFLLLIAILCFTAFYLRKTHATPIQGHGWSALFRLGIRNAMHRPARSLLCAGLIASATFIVVSMEAFRKDPENASLDPKGGTGGYSFIAESDLPIVHDLNSDAGREAAGIPGSELAASRKITFIPFRERPGDDASCLNLYAPQEPRILGVLSNGLAGRFSFQNSLASSEWEKQDPWRLLQASSEASDPVIPAIADANTIQYILHLSLGSELTVRGSNGDPVRLRLVGALKDSIFQGSILISINHFLRVFPDQQGYQFFLLDIPKSESAVLTQRLKEDLADYGFRIESSQERLSAFHQVENTYLSTFQSLGSLGLMLGTVGLAAVLLRNVLERRGELALLRAVGYRRRILSLIILTENIALLVWGLASGTVCALLAILPALYSRGASFPIGMAGATLAAVLAAGLAASLFAVWAALRSPLLPALRSE